jgi:hypothetical protein
MKCFLHTIEGLLLFVVTSTILAGEHPNTLTLPELGHDSALVSAEVSNVVPGPYKGWFTATLKVTHVYAGNSVHEGDSFVVPSSGDAPDVNGTGVRPVPKVGEQGLWVVKVHKGEAFSHNLLREFHGVFPARKGIDKRYDQAKKLAEAVEEVYHAEPVKAENLLNHQWVSSVPEVSMWAVRSLAEVAPGAIIERANDLSGGGKVGIPGQTAGDEALCRLLKEKWIESDDRRKLLMKWATTTPSEFDAEVVGQWLDQFSQHADSKDQALVDAMQALILNENYPKPIRLNLIHALWVMVDRHDLSVPAMSALREIEKTAKDQKVQADTRVFIDKAEKKEGGEH